MLRIAVVDVTAEARNRIARELSELQDCTISEVSLLPIISVQQLAPEEVKFHGSPDLLIVGDEIISNDVSIVGRLRSILPDTPIVARLRSEQETLVLIEDLARLGADDTITEKIDSISYIKKIILHCRRPKKNRTANLILFDSAKGGLGVTSLSAGFAEVAIDTGKTVALIDLDSETQDLSRFLQNRPFINENLELLIDGGRPISEEFVRQTLCAVWGEDENLYCMSPCALPEDGQGFSIQQIRNFMSILEIVDSIFDVVIVDVAGVRGTLLKTLYRVADSVVITVGNDPACLYATIGRVKAVKKWLSPNSQFLFLENCPSKNGLPSNILREEINIATKSEGLNWFPKTIPYCSSANRWPGSGDTILSHGRRSLRSALKHNASTLGFGDAFNETTSPEQRYWAIFDILKDKLSRRLPAPVSAAASVINQSSLGSKPLPLFNKPLGLRSRAATSREVTEALFEKLAEDPILNSGEEKILSEEGSDMTLKKAQA